MHKLMIPLKPSATTRNSQAGFTLIELMVALVLGLLISAAALQLFFNSSNNLRIQEGADDVQDAVVFSLSYVQKEIAMANLGAYQPMTQDSAWTGIILTASNDHPTEVVAGTGNKRQIGNLRGVKGITADHLTKTVSTSDSSTVKAKGGAALMSDQLTIQYRAPFAMSDCEGRNIDKDTMVVERFFTRKDTTGGSNDIVLACDSGTYELAGDVSPSQVAKDSYVLTGMGTKSTVLVNRVDYFKIKLGIQAKDGLIYLTPAEYMTLKDSAYKYKAPIVAVQIGVLTRGTDPISGEAQTDFNVLGTDVEMVDTNKKYVRRVYESTIRLRNGLTR
jgi:type IV pilus assembly protein PilW